MAPAKNSKSDTTTGSSKLTAERRQLRDLTRGFENLEIANNNNSQREDARAAAQAAQARAQRRVQHGQWASDLLQSAINIVEAEKSAANASASPHSGPLDLTSSSADGQGQEVVLHWQTVHADAIRKRELDKTMFHRAGTTRQELNCALAGAAVRRLKLTSSEQIHNTREHVLGLLQRKPAPARLAIEAPPNKIDAEDGGGGGDNDEMMLDVSSEFP